MESAHAQQKESMLVDESNDAASQAVAAGDQIDAAGDAAPKS